MSDTGLTSYHFYIIIHRIYKAPYPFWLNAQGINLFSISIYLFSYLHIIVMCFTHPDLEMSSSTKGWHANVAKYWQDPCPNMCHFHTHRWLMEKAILRQIRAISDYPNSDDSWHIRGSWSQIFTSSFLLFVFIFVCYLVCQQYMYSVLHEDYGSADSSQYHRHEDVY